jgi:hypothetical protein
MYGAPRTVELVTRRHEPSSAVAEMTETILMTYQIVVCGSIVPDPLQTLEPVTGPAGRR